MIFIKDVRFVGLSSFKSVGSTPRTRKALKKWEHMYGVFLRKRFRRYSQGKEDWPKLKPATIKAKMRKYTPYRSRLILRATDKMIRSIQPRLKSRTSTDRGFVAKVQAVDGRKRYPKGPKVIQVVGWHDQGVGTLPKREIVVPPDNKTLEKMAEVMWKATEADAGRRKGLLFKVLSLFGF